MRHREIVPVTWSPLRILISLLAVGGLAVTTAVTLPRMLDPQSYLVSVLATAAPIGVFTGFLSFLLLLGLSASRGRGRRVCVAAAAAAAGLTALHIWWLTPLFTGAIPAAGPGRSLTIMSQNFEYGSVPALSTEVSKADVDILILVDLTPAQFTNVMSSRIPPEFAYSGGTDRNAPSHTLVFSKYPLNLEKRITPGASSVLYTVSSPELGRFDLAAVHPAPPYIDSTKSWHSEYRMITEAFAQHFSAADPLPLVAAGDFNASQDHQPFRKALCGGALRDAVELRNAGWKPTFRAGGYPLFRGVVLPPVAQIDHVLVSSQVAVTSVQTIQIPGADHAGLLVQLAKARPTTSASETAESTQKGGGVRCD